MSRWGTLRTVTGTLAPWQLELVHETRSHQLHYGCLALGANVAPEDESIALAMTLAEQLDAIARVLNFPPN